MRKGLAVLIAAGLVVGLLCGITAAQGAPTMRVLVGFKGSPDVGLVKGLGGEVHHAYSIIPAVCATLPAPAVEALKNNPAVAYVEPDGTVYAMAQTLPWGVNRIGAPAVNAGGNKGTGVKVCIVDSGVDMDHPDLAALGGYNFVKGTNFPDDDNGHGSHCSGIVAALDNTIGVVGVAPEASLYACKVLNSSGSGSTSNCIAGIDWARVNGMKIINMSWGSTQYNASLEAACNNAWNAGLVLVAAAGNVSEDGGGGSGVIYPAKYASVMAVSATNSSDKLATWSCKGPEVELAAPGQNIYSCYKTAGYKTLSGTSMASPHVVGVAALVWAAHPGYTNQQVRDAMNFTAIDLGTVGRDTSFGYGLVWAPGAVAY